MKKNKLFGLLIFLMFLSVSIPAISQVKTQNLSNIRVDELSDDQIRAYLRQMEASGVTDAQLDKTAQLRGMSPEEIKKLRLRVDKLKKLNKNLKDQSDPNKVDTEGLLSESDSLMVMPDPDTEAEKALMELRSKIFGSNLFQNKNLAFEPNINIPTPKNYVIGPKDLILIDIYGNSEASYSYDVSSDGNINVEYAGVIPVSGLTIEAATSRIKSRLLAVYPGLRSGNTKLNVSIGAIRSIKVTVTGEVQKPGTYTLPSLATIFTALYSSGGPTEIGSFRTVELIRGGLLIAKLDIYDFLIEGQMRNNVGLQDEDIIRIPVYKSRIEITGEVKRTGIFELLDGESFADLLRFAGDFTENAFKTRVKLIKNTDSERRIIDMVKDQYGTYKPSTGEKYFVDRILERFVNRVTIEGAVFRPGQYELTSGLKLSELVRKAEGVKEDAFLSRGYLTRLKADNQTEILSFDLSAILNGTKNDIKLSREDIITISSIFDLREEYKVAIEGEIREPGKFDYSENMTLEELILKSGGFKEGASINRIEISRRVKNSDDLSRSAATAEIFQVDVDINLKLKGAPFILQPFDIVSVRSATGYEIQKQIKVTGEVLYPGTYTILRKDERISDIIKRAGGLTVLAYVEGSSLKRPGVPDADSTKATKEKVNTIKRLQSTVSDSLSLDKEEEEEVIKNINVGIDMERILAFPGSSYDLIMEENDIINVPKQLQTIKVSGEVLSPVTIIYEKGKTFRRYIYQSGGFSDKSLKRRSYILYANGAVKSTRKILLFNNYPRVVPGSEIFVPKKIEKRPTSVTEIVGISSTVASLAVIILNLIR
jgi:protein involved in polysaccharide export with SLBB domain